MNRHAWRGALLAACVLLAPYAGADARAPQLLASIAPLALIAQALAGASLRTDVLPGTGATPHDFVLRPSGIAAVEAASLFVWMGPEMERPLGRVLHKRAVPHAFAVLPALGDDGAGDPHRWLDPRGATAIARVLAAQLQARGLVAEAHLDQGLARFSSAMLRREETTTRLFEGSRGVPFLVLHDGLRPFVMRYGLAQVGALPTAHEQQPGARTLATLRRAAQASGARCLFREPTDSADLAASLVDGTSMRVVVIDPLARDASDFDRFLEELARRIASCLSGAPTADGA